MRRHAKAATAGSNRQKAAKLVLPVSVFAALLALLVVVGSASATKTHLLKEVFGPAAQPSFTTPRGMAIDQGTGEVYVIDAGSPPSVKRYNEDGTASNFSALSSNVIDGAGGADATPQGSLTFGAANRVQIAIDESGTATDGDIYVAQQSAKLLDVFDSTGTYKGQLTESSEGPLGEICGVAVDAAGKLYLGDIAGKIHVYAPAANPPVNGDSSANFATVAAPCQIAAGTGATAGFLFVNRSNGELLKVDSATGEVKYAIGSTSHRTVYINPATGHVYAPRQTGSNSEVVEYDASGAASATTVSSFKPGSTIEGTAVRASDANVLITRSGQANAEVYGPTVTQPDVTSTAVSNNTGTRATLNGTVNPDGVELSECFFEWGQGTGSTPYTDIAPCAESNATIGAGTSPVAVHADLSGLVPQGQNYHYRLVAKNPESPAVNGSNQNVITPQTVTAIAATGITPTEATLNGTVNPDTATISECAFEWGEEKTPVEAFQAFPETAACVPGPGGITGETPVAVEADIAGLHPGTTYVYRLRVGYPGATITNPSVNQTPLSLQTLGPVIEASWAQDITRSEVALKAQINPEGAATTYRFEYGKTPAYGSQTEELNVDSDSALHTLSRFLDHLEPGTIYHYRVIATSGVAENVGPDQTFSTFAVTVPNVDCPNQQLRSGLASNLPDCRGYEMVTPVDKGTDIFPKINGTGVEMGSEQAAVDGDKIAYPTKAPFGDAAGAPNVGVQYIASRGSDGWSSHAITPPHAENRKSSSDQQLPSRYSAFSPDLSVGFLWDDAKPSLTESASQDSYNFYLRDNVNESYEAITTEFLSGGETLYTNSASNLLMGYSADGNHTVFQAAAQLTPDAHTGSGGQVYDYHDGELEVVSVLPGGEPAQYAGSGSAQGAVEKTAMEHVISDDGSRVFWTSYESDFGKGSAVGKIYVRVDGETTIPVSESVTAEERATFQAASADGSRALFTITTGASAGNSGPGDLYRTDVDSETASLIAGGVDSVKGVLGESEDLSRIYFFSTEALTPDATAGQANVYLDDEGTKTLIATLAPGDEKGFQAGGGGTATNGNESTGTLTSDFSQVTPDGRYAVFNSIASLTGYDNTSVETGEPAIEVYRFDALTEQIVCISCNPSGGRPQTDFLPNPHWGNSVFNAVQAAAWLPTPRRGTYIPRMVRDDGKRIFFNALDALVPEDTNGVQDVYEWEAQGVGDCAKAEGCVSLISTGESPVRSTFIDADPEGRDVFFRTAASIDPEDPGLKDIYDARVGGGFERPVPLAECEGDACQSAPEPPLEPSLASAAFRGKGNPKPVLERNCGARAKRAAKLSRRARLLRRQAKRARAPKRARALRRRSARFAKRARATSKGAKRCRRASRRAGR